MQEGIIIPQIIAISTGVAAILTLSIRFLYTFVRVFNNEGSFCQEDSLARVKSKLGWSGFFSGGKQGLSVYSKGFLYPGFR